MIAMTARGKRMILCTVGLSVVVGVAAAGLLVYKDQTWVDSPAYQRNDPAAARTLVVVYSRSGNTLDVAKEAARYFDADLLRIHAAAYPRTIAGQRLAGQHADELVTTTPIVHEPVDLARYELVILCSPTWWFRPAVPLWSFVEKHDLVGRPVFLIMTGNSRMKESRTAPFRQLVHDKGGRFLQWLFVRRGRIYWQKTPAELRFEVRQALRAREQLWQNVRRKVPGVRPSLR